MARLGQFRRDTLVNWQAANPILADGEFVLIALDPNKPHKYQCWTCGDGTTPFSELIQYDISSSAIIGITSELGNSNSLAMSQKGVTKNFAYLNLIFKNSVSETRNSVPFEARKLGLIITYNPGTGWIKEQFIGNSFLDADWELNENWKAEILNENIEAIAQQAQKASDDAQKAAQNADKAAQDANKAGKDAEDAVQKVEEAISNITDGLPINTILRTAEEAGNIFGKKWLQCDGRAIGFNEYLDVIAPMNTKITNLKDEERGNLNYHYYNLNNIIICIREQQYSSNGLYLSYSRNKGKTWSDFTKFTEETFVSNCIFQANNRLYLISQSKCQYTIDGQNWNSIDNIFNNYSYRTLLYANGMYVYYTSNQTWYSLDGVTFSSIYSFYEYKAFVFDNFIFGYQGSYADGYKYFRFDKDTRTWILMIDDIPNFISSWIKINDNKYLALSINGENEKRRRYLSDDGITWNSVSISDLGEASGGAKYLNGNLLGSFDLNGDNENFLMYSEDLGENWTRIGDDIQESWDINVVNNDYFLLTQYAYLTEDNMKNIYISTDGKNIQLIDNLDIKEVYFIEGSQLYCKKGTVNEDPIPGSDPYYTWKLVTMSFERNLPNLKDHYIKVLN